MKGYKKFIYSAFLLIIFASFPFAAANKFVVVGQVIDAQTCDPLPGIKIIIRQEEYNNTYEVITDEEGKFKKIITLPADITIDVNEPGMYPFHAPWHLTLGFNEIGYIPLLKQGQPITKVCPLIKESRQGKEMQKAVAEIPEIPEEKGLSPKFQEAKTSIQLNDFDGAIPILLEELKANPNNFAVNFFLGVAYFQKENNDLAIQYWEKALTISPKYEVAKNLAKAYEKNNDRTKAAELMQKAAELKVQEEKAEPSVKAQAYFDSGIYWYNANNPDMYYKSFSKVVEYEPTNGDAWYYIGMYYFSKAQNKKCVDAMEKALANNVSEENKPTVIAIRDAAKAAL